MSDDLIDQLRTRLETQQERIRQLEALLAPHNTSIPQEWALTASEARVFAHLTTRPMCTKDSIMAAMYSDRIGDSPELKIVDVFICKLRKKLTPLGVKIQTVWGQGYQLVDRERFIPERAGLKWTLGLISEHLDAGELASAQAILSELRTHLDEAA